MQQTLNKRDINRVRITVAVWSYATSVLIAIIWFSKQDWFGINDLKGFSIISIGFAFGASLLGTRIATIVRSKSRTLKYSIGVIAGVLYGTASVMALTLLIGMWILAFSFPIILCWGMGGIFGFVAGIISLKSRNNLFSFAQVMSFGLIAYATILFYNPLLIYASNDRELHVVIVKCDGGVDPLVVESDNYGKMNIKSNYFSSMNSVKLNFTREDEKLLHLAGVKGNCRVTTYGVHGSGKFSKAIIVLREIPLQVIELYQPDEFSIVYIQDGLKFSIYPENAPTLSRTIELRRSLSDINTNDSNNVSYLVELAGGAKQGQTAARF